MKVWALILVLVSSARADVFHDRGFDPGLRKPRAVVAQRPNQPHYWESCPREQQACATRPDNSGFYTLGADIIPSAKMVYPRATCRVNSGAPFSFEGRTYPYCPYWFSWFGGEGTGRDLTASLALVTAGWQGTATDVYLGLEEWAVAAPEWRVGSCDIPSLKGAILEMDLASQISFWGGSARVLTGVSLWVEGKPYVVELNIDSVNPIEEWRADKRVIRSRFDTPPITTLQLGARAWGFPTTQTQVVMIPPQVRYQVRWGEIICQLAAEGHLPAAACGDHPLGQWYTGIEAANAEGVGGSALAIQIARRRMQTMNPKVPPGQCGQ